MKKYIEPRYKVVDMAPDNVVLGHSFDWADVKKKKLDDEELWEEEEVEVNMEQLTGIPSKTTSVWNKEW